MNQPVARFEGAWLHLTIKAKPGARSSGLGQVRAGALPVSVREKAEGGRATEAILKLLAAEFGVARADISLLGGAFAPLKRVRIRLPAKLPAALLQALATLRDSGSS